MALPGDLISRIRAEKLDACPGVRLDLEGLSSLCLYHNIYLWYVFPGLLLEETKRAWARIEITKLLPAGLKLTQKKQWHGGTSLPQQRHCWCTSKAPH